MTPSLVIKDKSRGMWKNPPPHFNIKVWDQIPTAIRPNVGGDLEQSQPCPRYQPAPDQDTNHWDSSQCTSMPRDSGIFPTDFAWIFRVLDITGFLAFIQAFSHLLYDDSTTAVEHAGQVRGYVAVTFDPCLGGCNSMRQRRRLSSDCLFLLVPSGQSLPHPFVSSIWSHVRISITRNAAGCSVEMNREIHPCGVANCPDFRDVTKSPVLPKISASCLGLKDVYIVGPCHAAHLSESQ